eukprot:CAMPEP_0114260384 /NCGR_PEP_ID=MMETSP0058-20121206/20459_1 /TAXON_ID=36894 /ORGANISM="Pyramimonas parkeae, CCMP726" /LENGTH=430 /DNA_ID=CAMNT_0001375617 /DNA_START=349 /DNA_END=1641 /DNA_ORIENTATION=+
MLSIVAWAFAEVPQIVQNFATGHSEGMSIFFVLIWLTGDALNIIGCLLARALPTQLYIAYVYTSATVVLLFQHLVYNHIAWIKQDIDGTLEESLLYKDSLEEGDGDEHADGDRRTSADSQTPSTTSMAVPRTARPPPAAHGFFMSPRTFATSPLRDSHLTGAHSPWMLSNYGSPVYNAGMVATLERSPGQPLDIRRSLDVASFGHNALIVSPHDAGLDLSRSHPIQSTQSAAAETQQPGTHRLLSLSPLLIVGACGALSLMAASFPASSLPPGGQGAVSFMEDQTEGLATRRLLDSPHIENYFAQLDRAQVGEMLGWVMTIIYFSSRMPQIYLNIQRGSVEGLSSTMFILAICGNATYLASILTKSLAWKDIKPVLPWIVDAIGCLFMDSFIVCQYEYYRRRAIKLYEEMQQAQDIPVSSNSDYSAVPAQ